MMALLRTRKAKWLAGALLALALALVVVLALTARAEEQQAKLLVLMYHDLSEEPPADAESIQLFTTPLKFAADIEKLLKRGYLPISLEDYYLGLALPGQKYFIITFDDGYQGVYQYAYPILWEKQIPACIFFNTGMEHYPDFIHYWQLQELEQSGLIKIYTHLAYHDRATELAPEEYLRYLDASVEFLNTYVGEKTMFLAYPYGDYNEQTYQAARERGIALQLTQELKFPAEDILVRVNVPYDADIKKLIKAAPHN